MNYVKINPSGNITLLVTEPVPRAKQSEIANRLMQMDSDAEQVGFIEQAGLFGAAARLQMMGGEFCGNATMSLAAYLAQQDALADGEEKVYPLEVSGAEGIISCRIRREGGAFIGTVPMPLPREITEAEILPGLRVPLVRFAGIDHAIVPEGKLSAAQADAIIAGLCAGLDGEALGILLMGDEGNRIHPLVYVRSTDSAVWENSCGSGTAAVGAYYAFNRKENVRRDIVQPCPDTRIGVMAAYENGRICHLEITGKVRICEERDAQI